MTRNQSDRHYDDYSGERSNQKSYDDYNILEPSPEIDLSFRDDEDDELMDFSLMENASVLDYEE